MRLLGNCTSGRRRGLRRCDRTDGHFTRSLGFHDSASRFRLELRRRHVGRRGRPIEPGRSTRFYKSGPYRTLNGAVVALNFPALTAADLFNVIDVDETGASQASSGATKVWTGTTAAGDAASQTCAGFTAGDASSVQGEVGNLTSGSSGNWDADGAENCNKQLHIYCFEQ